MNKGVIFIQENYAHEKKVRYEFIYLYYLYYCDRETWKKTVNGKYHKSCEVENILWVKEECKEYTLEDDERKEPTQGVKIGDKKHDKIFKDILQIKKKMKKE